MPLFDFGSSKAHKYLKRIPGVSHETYDPYIERGQAAGDIMSEQFGRMSQDPSAFINALMRSYQPSEGYRFQQEQMGRAAANTAAAGGMRGTPLDQMQQQRITKGLLGEDMQRYLSNVLGAQQTGLAGQQGLYGTGFGASQALGSDLTNVLGQRAGVALRGGTQLGKLFGQLGGAALGGYFGGPMGAAIGSGLYSGKQDTSGQG